MACHSIVIQLAQS